MLMGREVGGGFFEGPPRWSWRRMLSASYVHPVDLLYCRLALRFVFLLELHNDDWEYQATRKLLTIKLLSGHLDGLNGRRNRHGRGYGA